MKRFFLFCLLLSWSIHLQANSGLYVINSKSNTVTYYDAETGTSQEIQVRANPTGAISRPDNLFVYVSNTGDGTLSIINATTHVIEGPPIAVEDSPEYLAVTPDGQFICVPSYNQKGRGSVSIISTSSRTICGPPISVGRGAYAIAIAPDGSKAYVTNELSRNVSVIDIAAQKVITTIEVGMKPKGISITPCGQFVYVVNYISDTVSIIQTSNHKVIDTITGIGAKPTDVAISSDGSLAYVTSEMQGCVSIIRTSDKAVIGSIDVGLKPQSIILNPDGTTGYVTNAGSNTVSVLDLHTNKAKDSLPTGLSPFGIALVTLSEPTPSSTASSSDEAELVMIRTAVENVQVQSFSTVQNTFDSLKSGTPTASNGPIPMSNPGLMGSYP